VSIHFPPLKKGESKARGAGNLFEKSPLTPLFQRGGLNSYVDWYQQDAIKTKCSIKKLSWIKKMFLYDI